MVRMDDSKSDRALDSRVDSTSKELQRPWHWCDGADMANGASWVLPLATCDSVSVAAVFSGK